MLFVNAQLERYLVKEIQHSTLIEVAVMIVEILFRPHHDLGPNSLCRITFHVNFICIVYWNDLSIIVHCSPLTQNLNIIYVVPILIIARLCSRLKIMWVSCSIENIAFIDIKNSS
ncbi:hypothetical protein ACOSP7_024249 [Xanthoceras sorbifolium]